MDEEKSVSPRSSEPAKTGKEMCSCGHRANKHAAGKYACQAPGGYKGFCPCMVFMASSRMSWFMVTRAIAGSSGFRKRLWRAATSAMSRWVMIEPFWLSIQVR